MANENEYFLDYTGDEVNEAINDARRVDELEIKINELENDLKLKQPALTANQIAAIDSTITLKKVQDYDNYETKKQKALEPDQLAAVNSGINSDLVTKFNNYETEKQDKFEEWTPEYYAITSGINSDLITKYNKYDSEKQKTLVSGENIATINNQSLLDNSNIQIREVPGFTPNDKSKVLSVNNSGDRIEWKSIENLGVSSAFTALTVAPTADNLDGTYKFVVLDTEPEQKFEGYFYIIKGGANG